MNVREKLVELLCEAQHIVTNTNKAEYLVEHGVTVQEWISTDERMPTEDDSADGYVAVVYARGDGVKTKAISLVDVVIAHPDLYDYWMPLNLPEPPKGE